MSSIASLPAVRRLFVISIVARLPLAMLGIGLLVHARHLTGSLVVAGAATGAYALGLAAGGPFLGRLVDRRGQTRVLLASGVASALGLVAAGSLPVGAPAPALVALAAAIGASTPPVGECVRTLLPGLLTGDDSVRAAYALDASVVEITWVAGPPLVLGAGALLSTGAALALAGAVLLAATAAFTAQPASRRSAPVTAAPGGRGGLRRSPAVRTLALALLGVGGLLGAAEVAVTASTSALGSAAAAGPLLALWGAGSLAGGLIAARAGGGARTAAGLALVLGGLAAGHLALAAAAGSVVALGAGLLVAGAAIAPAYAALYAMVERSAPAGTLTEAFAWLATAAAVGGAVGSAAAGAVAEAAGPQAAFLLAGAAGVSAVVVVLSGARTLDGPGAAARVATAAA